MTAVPVRGGSLVAHLHDAASLMRNAPDVLCLPERSRKRLLDVAVYALSHRPDGLRRMHVIRRRDVYDVEAKLRLVVEHPAVVGVRGD